MADHWSVLALSSFVTALGAPRMRRLQGPLLVAAERVPELRQLPGRVGGAAAPLLARSALSPGPEPGAQVLEQRRDRERAAARALEDLGRREPAAVAVDLLAQPLAERRQVAGADPLVEVVDVAAGGLPQLAGDHVAEAVGGEVAEGAAGPVDVLEDAAGVVGDLEAEVVAVARVPGLGQVLEREVVLEDLQLELEADQDVEVVGDLVGLDPDQRALDAVGGAEELVDVDRAEGVGEALAQLRQDVARGRAARGRPSSPRAGSGTRAARASAASPAASAPARGRLPTRRGRGPPRAWR